MVEWAIITLDGIDHTDPVWGNAATLFDNRIEVSKYYSIDKAGSATNLTTLQQILTGITADVATVATAKATIDDLLSNPGVIDLASLNGSNGFRLDGVLTSDKTGFSVSGAGDINNDGFDDVIVGAPHSYDDSYSGASLVVFGKATGFSASLSLSSLDGSNGFRLNGVTGGEGAGLSVSGAGDFNGDGFDDLLIGAPLSDVIGHDAGFSYVVFGKASGFSASFELSSLDGSNGFRLDPPANNLTGWSVSGAGDINGDGFDDVIIGAPYAAPNGEKSGSSYIVFGQASGFSTTLDLSSLDGSTGFRVDGVSAESQEGISVNAGDVNGDGFNDLLIGAYLASPNGEGSGSSYVVFGKDTGFDATLDLSSLDGDNGFRMDGVAAGDESGYSISSAGDVNGDGFDDVIVGAPKADSNGDNSGVSYVIFGKASGFDATLALSNLDGSNGFRLDGISAEDYSGKSVSNAGDFNGDGFDDLIVGSYAADANGDGSGASYVVFGKASGFSATLNLSNLSSSDGFSLVGLTSSDGMGRSVNGAGDVNNDGFDDLIIGAPFADGNTFNSGAAYIIFGHSSASETASLKKFEFDSSDIYNHDAAMPLIGVNVATDFL
ncbi:MAG: FG-GAP repeat protein [Nitrosomonas sp.]|nr:FG-GAP repeat protein [Nitrosomonas sp.]MBP6076853.1 FG-GAP repeat protein [Nitrosomonas sp.]